MSQPTDDVRAGWFNFIRRLQAAVSGNRGHAVITVKVVVGPDGLPIVWTEPQCVKLEPMSRTENFLRLIIDT